MYPFYVGSGSFATGSSRQQVNACAWCPESGSFQSISGSANLDTQQDFEPFRRAEACDYATIVSSRQLTRRAGTPTAVQPAGTSLVTSATDGDVVQDRHLVADRGEGLDDDGLA